MVAGGLFTQTFYSWILKCGEEVILQSCFLDVLPRHTNMMADKAFNLFDECTARGADLILQKEECISSF